MKTVIVKSRNGSYPVLVGKKIAVRTGNLIKRLGLSGKVMVVSQEPVARIHAAPLLAALRKTGFSAHLYLLPDGETAKCQKELYALYDALVEKDFERRDIVLALGGGVAGDLAGFAAATYLRGVPFINLGTTLLAQVDSAIGGKTGIDLPSGKNLVGAFYPAKLVVLDTEILKTLPKREFQASLAEVVKYGVIRDARLFHLLESKAASILGGDSRLWERLVIASARIKAAVVSRDEFECKGERMILNLGHTFGHAVEQTLQYRKLMHGEAVSIGMAAAARMAVKLGLLSRPASERIVRVLESFHLPVSLSGLDLETEDILAAMQRDKKKHAGRLRFVLPVQIGRVIVRDDVPLKLAGDILRELGGS